MVISGFPIRVNEDSNIANKLVRGLREYLDAVETII